MNYRRKPLNLNEALIRFAKVRAAHPDICRLGQTLVREIQHLHKVLRYTRRGFPATYNDYIDPAQLDAALARTAVTGEIAP